MNRAIFSGARREIAAGLEAQKCGQLVDGGGRTTGPRLLSHALKLCSSRLLAASYTLTDML